MDYLKKSPLVPVIAILLLLFFIAKQSKFSVIDIIADRVIEKMELKYSPYGVDYDDRKNKED